MTESELNREWDSDTPLPIIFGSQHMSIHSIREDGTLIKHETVYIWPNTKKIVVCPPKDVEVEVRVVQ